MWMWDWERKGGWRWRLARRLGGRSGGVGGGSGRGLSFGGDGLRRFMVGKFVWVGVWLGLGLWWVPWGRYRVGMFAW